MNEYKTIDSLLKKFADPIKEDYEALAVSLMKNFSIAKCEKDSEGVRNVKYRIADLEIYLLTSSSCHPKVFVKEFCYFLMSCHQHCLGVNLLVQR